jgi:hypothetical protein
LGGGARRTPPPRPVDPAPPARRRNKHDAQHNHRPPPNRALKPIFPGGLVSTSPHLPAKRVAPFRDVVRDHNKEVGDLYDGIVGAAGPIIHETPISDVGIPETSPPPTLPGSTGLPQPGIEPVALPNDCLAIICSEGIPTFGDPFGNFWDASRNFGDDLARRVGDWWNWLTGNDKSDPITRADPGDGEEGQRDKPKFRGDTSHIFRDARGHLSDDTPENRELLQDAVSPENLDNKKILLDGSMLETYHQNLPDGRQVWVEVRDGIITNGGVNNTPR